MRLLTLLLLAATLLSLAACNDAAPATADAGSLAATPTDAAALIVPDAAAERAIRRTDPFPCPAGATCVPVLTVSHGPRD